MKNSHSRASYYRPKSYRLRYESNKRLSRPVFRCGVCRNTRYRGTKKMDCAGCSLLFLHAKFSTGSPGCTHQSRQPIEIAGSRRLYGIRQRIVDANRSRWSPQDAAPIAATRSPGIDLSSMAFFTVGKGCSPYNDTARRHFKAPHVLVVKYRK